MKKFRVMISASVDCELEAENEDDAMDIAEETWFRKMQLIESKHIMVHEIKED